MATTLKVMASTRKRTTGNLGLRPLNKVLVNVFLSPEGYTRNLAQGIALQPVQCGSLRHAAYLFEPQVEVAARKGMMEVQRGSDVQNTIRTGGTPTDVDVNPDHLLEDGTEEQVVPYWRNCSDESSLSHHFEPNDVVKIMRPKSQDSDRLGLLLRLRIASLTFLELSAKLKRATPNNPIPPDAIDALRKEKARLLEMIKQVRAKLILTLENERPQRVVGPELGSAMEVSVKTPREDIQKLLTSENISTLAAVLDKQEEYMRLVAIANKMQTKGGQP
jgi:hypothetical protein